MARPKIGTRAQIRLTKELLDYLADVQAAHNLKDQSAAGRLVISCARESGIVPTTRQELPHVRQLRRDKKAADAA